MGYHCVYFQTMGDERGKLIALENNKNIPFAIKRVYYIFDTSPDKPRGGHAHTELEQIIIAMDGSCDFILDDGFKKEIITLNRPDMGLYIGKNIWREMCNFSYGCKLVILANDFYNEAEYIRDYKKFLNVVRDNDDMII